ncbi:MAG: FAD:protein FMN transferase, partial [Planctomycetota bacterium]
PVDLSEDLADVLERAIGISTLTDRAFDPTSGPLIRLWREAKQNRRVPTDDQIAAALSLTGIDGVRVVGGALEKAAEDRRFHLGAIGKGFAIDRAVGHLEACAVEDFLVYGGLSSVAARGRSGENDGWPVGIGDPLRPNRRLGTLVLKNAAMATSGANNQFFRVGREKFGHIVDPRTGRPADGLLSVTVVTGSATLSDALSTAFYVMGLENSLTFCNTHMGIGTILIPNPDRGGRLTPVVHGIDPAHLDWSS